MIKDRFQQVKTKKVIRLFKDELGGKIKIEFVELRAKPYAFVMDDYSKHKKTKGTRKCVIKRGLMVQNYKDSLFNSNDDKRLQTFDEITRYPYGTNTFKVCESEFQKKQF